MMSCATLIDVEICVCLCLCLVITFYQTKDATPALAMLLPLFVLPANPAFWPKRDAEVSNIYHVIYYQYICPHFQGRAEPSSGEPCLTWEVVEKKMAWGVVILIGDEDNLDDNGDDNDDDDDYRGGDDGINNNHDHLYTFGSLRRWLRSKCWCRCLWSDDSNWETGSRLHITHHDDKQRNACLCDDPKWKNISIAAGAS